MKEFTRDKFRVSFATKRLGTICSGYTLTIASKKGDSFTLPEDFKNSIYVGKGIESNRNYVAETHTYSDPIYKILNNVFYLSLDKTHNKFPKSRTAFTPEDLEEIFRVALFEKDAEKFLSFFVPRDKGVNLSVKGKNLLSASPMTQKLRNASANQARGMFQMGQVVSALDILNTYLPVMGLELYWNGQNNYSVEPPRILDSSEVAGVVKEDDILEMSIGEDLFNAPDLVIPRFNSVDGLLKGQLDIVMAQVINNVKDCRGSELFKVSTFDIPPFLIRPFTIGYKQFLATADKTTGVLKYSDAELAKDIVNFYTRLGQASAMYQIQSGSITAVFQDRHFIAPAWYKIGGQKYFVSEIRHDLTRAREVTIFTIVGTDKSLKPVDCSSMDIEIPDNDEAFEKNIQKVEEHDKKAIEARKKVIKEKFMHPYTGTHKLEKGSKKGYRKFGNILPSRHKINSKITGAAKLRIPTEVE